MVSQTQKDKLVADAQQELADVEALVVPADIQQTGPVPDQNWVEGTTADLNVLSYFTSPSGKTLSLQIVSALPSGVTLTATGLHYDGVGVFETATQVTLNVVAT